MSTQAVIPVGKFDEWIRDDSDVAALVMREWLEPVEGKDAIIFPPTYAKPERVRDDDWIGYNIDGDGDSSVCLIDSVGSQANRMEPIFKRPRYQHLVPQVSIKAGDSEIHLLDAGHRAADAIVRFSSLRKEFEDAFTQLRAGDAEPLAKLAPTSLVFGVWDSRGTQVKVPRLVRSVIRAFNVRVLHRSAQYVPAINYVGKGLLDEPANKIEQDRLAELGLSHRPASWTHGGVQVLGEIRRDATLNLSALRTLAAGRRDPLPVRRYILGLALVSFTAPPESFLREGCQLVPAHGRPAEWSLVHHDGTRTSFKISHKISHDEALAYAEAAAISFGVGPDRQATFDPQAAKDELALSKEERKRARRSGGSRAEEGGEE
jgi:CRISPR-associated protein Csb1